MDKKAFFKALSDEAAQPDPKFISALHDKVIAIAGGTPPPTSGLNFPTSGLIAVAAVTLAIIGAVTYGVVKGDPAPIATDEPTTVAVEEAQVTHDVLAEVTEANEQTNADETDAQNEVVAETPTVDSVQTDTPSNPAQPVTNPSIPPTTPPATPNENYFVEFWTVPLFKISPVFPSTPVDYAEEVAELNYDWGQSSPDGSITKNHFVARATASKYLEPGKYVLNVEADDAIRAYIDGKLVHDRWNITPGGTQDRISFAVWSSADEATKIVIEYFEFQESAHFKAEIIKQ